MVFANGCVEFNNLKEYSLVKPDYWENVEDIFDPMNYIKNGYFEMNAEQIMKYQPELIKSESESFNPDLDPFLIRSWSDGPTGREYREAFGFSKDQLESIQYSFGFNSPEEAKTLFLQLCERMQKITDLPRWEGYWTSSFDVDENNFREIPIGMVEEYFNNEIYVNTYQYTIDKNNKYYGNYYEEKGYHPFDPITIKKDAQWIIGLEDTPIITISYTDSSSRNSLGLTRAKIEVGLRIERQ